MTKSIYAVYRGEGSNIVNRWPEKVRKYFLGLHVKKARISCRAISPDKKFYCTRNAHKHGPHVAHAPSDDNWNNRIVVAVWD